MSYFAKEPTLLRNVGAGRVLAGMLLALALTAVASGAAGAQEVAPLILRLPANARTSAQGDALVGGRGSDMVFSNPAQIGRTTGTFFGVTRHASTGSQFAMSSSLSIVGMDWSLFAHALSYSADDYPVNRGDLVREGSTDGLSAVAGLALSDVRFGMRIGVTVKQLVERFGAAHASGLAFDVGVARDISRFTLGVVAQNLGEDLSLDGTPEELPLRMALGVSSAPVMLGTFVDGSATAAVVREPGGVLSAAGGVELVYEPVQGYTAALRVGAHRRDDRGAHVGAPITFGAALGVDRITLDYALERRRGSLVHQLSMRVE